jgi:hypothetical protein
MPRNNADFTKGKVPLSKDITRAWVRGKITGQEAQELSESNPQLRGRYEYSSGSAEQIKAIHKKAGLSSED